MAKANSQGSPKAVGTKRKTSLSRSGSVGSVNISIDGQPIEVTPELEEIVHRAHKGLIQPLQTEMTTNEAAEFLDVSRPFVIKLIRNGELPCRMVGKHRRVPSEALVSYREKMYLQAKAAADEMVKIGQESGLYDDEE